MSLENHFLKTDGKTMEPCCEDIYLAILGGRIIASRVKYHYAILGDDNTALINGTNCPFCGAKLEYVKTLVGGQ